MVRERLAAGRLQGDEEHLTDRCFRGGDPNTRTNRGLGLGLAFVRDVVAAHDGGLDIASVPGRARRSRSPCPGTARLGAARVGRSPSPTIPVT